VITRPQLPGDPLERERLVIVADRFAGRPLADDVRRQYPDWNVITCDTYMSGIVELSHHPARTVLACVDPGLAQLDSAIAGLRQAAPPKAKIILCCTPQQEPVAMRVVAAGADDYVLYPVEGEELDAAIGYARPQRSASDILSAAPGATMQELNLLGEALSSLTGNPRELIEKLAELVQTALSASGAAIIVEGAVATSGAAVAKPVLSAPLRSETGILGQLTVAQRDGLPYASADMEKLTRYAAIAGHVLQAASKHRQWQQLAVTDECSRLPNRRYLNIKLEAILEQAAKEHFPVTFLLFDVDDFKTYNDTFGHQAGDEIIRVIGELFKKHCREQDIVARYGGDEFAVVFWDVQGPRAAGSAHPDCALVVLERFKEALQSHKFASLTTPPRARLTVSGGLATFPWDATTSESLLKRADEALLAAKRAGKNRIFLIGQHDDASEDRSE